MAQKECDAASGEQWDHAQPCCETVQVLLLGEASALLGVRQLRVSHVNTGEGAQESAMGSIGALIAQLCANHDVPMEKLARPDFRFALNGKVLRGDFSQVKMKALSAGDELAILPPVTGG